MPRVPHLARAMLALVGLAAILAAVAGAAPAANDIAIQVGRRRADR